MGVYSVFGSGLRVNYCINQVQTNIKLDICMKIFWFMLAYFKKNSYLCDILKIKIMLNAEPDSNTSPKGMGKEL